MRAWHFELINRSKLFIHKKATPSSDPSPHLIFSQSRGLGVVHGKLHSVNSAVTFLASRSLQPTITVSEAKSEWGGWGRGGN